MKVLVVDVQRIFLLKIVNSFGSAIQTKWENYLFFIEVVVV